MDSIYMKVSLKPSLFLFVILFLRYWRLFDLSNICLVAGDVTDNESILFETFQVLTKQFDATFFIPGNHDVWIRNWQNQVKPLITQNLCYANHVEILFTLHLNTRNRSTSHTYIQMFPIWMLIIYFDLQAEPGNSFERMNKIRSRLRDELNVFVEPTMIQFNSENMSK